MNMSFTSSWPCSRLFSRTPVQNMQTMLSLPPMVIPPRTTRLSDPLGHSRLGQNPRATSRHLTNSRPSSRFFARSTHFVVVGALPAFDVASCHEAYSNIPSVLTLSFISSSRPCRTCSRSKSPHSSSNCVSHSVPLNMLSSTFSTVFRLFPSVLTSRLRVVILCPLHDCLPSLRRHCCLNSIPVPHCCSNSLLSVAHPSVLPPGSTSFGLFYSRLLCLDIPSCAFVLLHRLHSASQLLFKPPSAVFLRVLVSPSP